MTFSDKLQTLRKQKALSQEQLAEALNISRQAIAKWETGASLPDLTNILLISDFFGISLDRLVKPEEKCVTSLNTQTKEMTNDMINFLFEAKEKTYAANAPEAEVSCRLNAHDLVYERGVYTYIDTYLGSEIFSGQEGIWDHDLPTWAMNYHGRVLDDRFEGKVLKSALTEGARLHLQRGPENHHVGDYTYHCQYNGSFEWYQGYECIYYEGTKVYECHFHGGIVKE